MFQEAEKKKRVMIFGAGEAGRRAWEHIHKDVQVLCFLDNDRRKQGAFLQRIRIEAPEHALDPNVDQIFIASQYGVEIFDQLLQLGVPIKKIDVLDPSMLRQYAGFPTGIRNLLLTFLAGLLLILSLLVAYC